MDVRGQSYSVIGAARSGVAVATLLQAHGASVFVSDSGSAERLSAAKAALDAAGIACEFGVNSPRALEATTLVVSPGVPSNVPIVAEALRRGIRVVSELEVASWFCPAPIVAVTGTNGKTTTTSLLGAMFQDVRRPVVVAGNIGTAFSAVVDQASPAETVVLEVSSFQLDYIAGFRPRVALLLNLTPDHLDRYDHSYEKYIAAKCRIFENQRDGDTLIYNADDAEVSARVAAGVHPSVRKLAFSLESLPAEGAGVESGYLAVAAEGVTTRILPVEEIAIRGPHNLANAMAAVLAAWAMGVNPVSLRDTLASFKGVEHRLEFVRALDGVNFVNDSKATNVDSVWYALQSFTSPIVVLMGGRDKGNDYSRLYDPVVRHVRAVVAIGESADKVVAAFNGRVPVTRAASMDAAVKAARQLALPGDVVLLSPACASFDWFKDYEDRGRAFKEIVRGLTPKE